MTGPRYGGKLFACIIKRIITPESSGNFQEWFLKDLPMAKRIETNEVPPQMAGFILIQDPTPFFEETESDSAKKSSKPPISGSFGKTDPILASGDWSEEEIQAALKLGKLSVWQRVKRLFCC